MYLKSRMRALTTAAAFVVLAAGSSGCMATAHPARAGIVYVREAPPRALRETRPASPGRNYAWIPGHYDYRGRAYVWVPGRYERPTFANLPRWEQGQWHHDRNGWYWVDGTWRA